jgi:hypothetical protein
VRPHLRRINSRVDVLVEVDPDTTVADDEYEQTATVLCGT